MPTCLPARLLRSALVSWPLNRQFPPHPSIQLCERHCSPACSMQVSCTTEKQELKVLVCVVSSRTHTTLSTAVHSPSTLILCICLMRRSLDVSHNKLHGRKTHVDARARPPYLRRSLDPPPGSQPRPHFRTSGRLRGPFHPIPFLDEGGRRRVGVFCWFCSSTSARGCRRTQHRCYTAPLYRPYRLPAFCCCRHLVTSSHPSPPLFRRPSRKPTWARRWGGEGEVVCVVLLASFLERKGVCY